MGIRGTCIKDYFIGLLVHAGKLSAFDSDLLCMCWYLLFPLCSLVFSQRSEKTCLYEDWQLICRYLFVCVCLHARCPVVAWHPIQRVFSPYPVFPGISSTSNTGFVFCNIRHKAVAEQLYRIPDYVAGCRFRSQTEKKNQLFV